MVNAIKGQVDQLIFRNSQTKISFSSKILNLQTLLWKGVKIEIIWMVFWFHTSQNFPLFISEEFFQSNISYLNYFIAFNLSAAFSKIWEWPALLLTIQTTSVSIKQASILCSEDLYLTYAASRLTKLSLMMTERTILQNTENSTNLHWLCSTYYHNTCRSVIRWRKPSNC